jgi:hypothetical protein
MKYFALPTWIIIRIMLLFLPNHPWNQSDVKITLDDWYTNQTELCKLFDIGLGVSFICCGVLFLYMYFGII